MKKQVKIYEPATDDTLTRADTRRMRLPFERGWEFYLVENSNGDIEATYDNYVDAREHALEQMPIAA